MRKCRPTVAALDFTNREVLMYVYMAGKPDRPRRSNRPDFTEDSNGIGHSKRYV